MLSLKGFSFYYYSNLFDFLSIEHQNATPINSSSNIYYNNNSIIIITRINITNKTLI